MNLQMNVAKIITLLKIKFQPKKKKIGYKIKLIFNFLKTIRHDKSTKTYVL